MKSKERHKLKENEFVRSVERAREVLAEHQREVSAVIAGIVVVLIVIGGYSWWRAARGSKANNMLASALAIAEAPVMLPPAPAPGSPPPVQPPGTFATERARTDAALPLLMAVATAYPSTDAGITARYRAAVALAEIGRLPEAEQHYQDVIKDAGRSSIYGRTARLGLGEVQMASGKFDQAITTFRELSTDTESPLPVDGVLMQLGQACARAGRKEEATRAFTRVVDEFPQSMYASDARQQLDDLKKG